MRQPVISSNQIRGTDGTIFGPDVKKTDKLYIFNKDLCQSLPLVYQEEVNHRGINTYRYTTSDFQVYFNRMT